MKKAVVMAVLGAVALAGGMAWLHPAIGVMVAGLELLAGAYLVQYVEARR